MNIITIKQEIINHFNIHKSPKVDVNLIKREKKKRQPTQPSSTPQSIT